MIRQQAINAYEGSETLNTASELKVPTPPLSLLPPPPPPPGVDRGDQVVDGVHQHRRGRGDGPGQYQGLEEIVVVPLEGAVAVAFVTAVATTGTNIGRDSPQCYIYMELIEPNNSDCVNCAN